MKIGILAILAAAFSYSLFGVFSREISKDFGTFYQYLSRSIFVLILVGLIAYKQGYFKKILPQHRKWFIIRSLIVTMIGIPFYLATVHLPLGTALFLFYSAAVISNYLFGSIFLDENLDQKKSIALLIAFLGMGLIFSGNYELNQPFYLLMAVIGGANFGLSSASSKKLNKDYSPFQIIFFSTATIILVMFPIVIARGEAINLNFVSRSWLANAGYGIVNIAASALTVYGYKHLEAQKASLLLLSELLFVSINGFILYSEVPNITTVMGGILILGAMTIPNTNLRAFQKFRYRNN